MRLLSKLASVIALALLLQACGGGGVASTGSGGSGIGGTGMTLVQGNVFSVDGQLYAHVQDHNEGRLLYWVVKPAYAQVADIVVSGGGRTTTVGSGGGFVLSGVTPSSNFHLRFTINGRDNAQVNIGTVSQGSVVTVRDISIDTRTSSAKPKQIEAEEPEEDKEPKQAPEEEDEVDESDADNEARREDEADEVDEADEADEADEEDEMDEVEEEEEEVEEKEEK